MKGIMILFHCESNTGYAIGRLEAVFFQMAMQLTGGDSSLIHFAYSSMERGKPTTLPSDFEQYVVIDSASDDRSHGEFIEQYIRKHQIQTLFGFDQPVNLPTYKNFRRGGIVDFIAYWGAPMSSVFGPFKRFLKRLDVYRHRCGPDFYIFESQGMANTAVLGRGISRAKTAVVYLGVDLSQFYPDESDRAYVYEAMKIPLHRRIFFYSGHMEQRKGVWVTMNAANVLSKLRPIDDWHIVLLGNQPGEEQWLLDMLTPQAREHVTFGGYRTDINKLHRGCYAGIIASTGWDSLTYSSLEMQASGLPLIASNLTGLNEAALPDKPQLLFEPGSHHQLANLIDRLLDNPDEQKALSELAAQRAAHSFSIGSQVQNLTDAVLKVKNMFAMSQKAGAE